MKNLLITLLTLLSLTLFTLIFVNGETYRRNLGEYQLILDYDTIHVLDNGRYVGRHVYTRPLSDEIHGIDSILAYDNR